MSLSKHLVLPGILGMLLVFALATPAQWDKKPYTAWSDKETQKLLDNSPWSKSMELSFLPERSSGQSSSNTGMGDNSKLQMRDPKILKFRVRLISAAPMLEALNRSGMIREEREQTLAHIRALNADKDHIIIALSCDYSRISLDDTGRRPKTLEEIRRKSFLEVKGGNRVFLQEYELPREDKLGWILVFPRFIDGKPFITPENTEVRFRTEVYLPSIFRFVEVSISYRTKEMAYDGKLEY